jgi:hypothetical protein
MIMASISNIIPGLIMIIYLGVLIYMISLAIRFVRAVEKIANKIESSDKI